LIHDYQLAAAARDAPAGPARSPDRLFLHFPSLRPTSPDPPWRREFWPGLLGATSSASTHTPPPELPPGAARRFFGREAGSSGSTGRTPGRSGSSRWGSTWPRSRRWPATGTCRRRRAGSAATSRSGGSCSAVDRLDYTKGIPRRLLASTAAGALAGVARDGGVHPGRDSLAGPGPEYRRYKRPWSSWRPDQRRVRHPRWTPVATCTAR